MDSKACGASGRVRASVLSMTSYSMLCCSWSKQAGRSKLAKAVLKLVGASLCSSWSLPNPPGYPQHPADQCVHSPVVAREDVSPVLVGENLLSPNRMTLLLHPLPHRASGASVGDFPSSRRVVVAVAAWKAILLLRSTAADANHHRFHHHGDLVWCRCHRDQKLRKPCVVAAGRKNLSNIQDGT